MPPSVPSQDQNAGPKIWIISTGTEILQGHYPDTNAQWLSRELMAMGFSVRRHMAIADDAESLREGLSLAVERADLVIMTGGLGPTADDLNRQTVADVFQTKLIEDERALREIEERFLKRGRKMPPSNVVQALIPAGATVLYNQWGTAPGFYLRPNETSKIRATMLALPGPPREMNPMFKAFGAPLILEQFSGGRRSLRTLTLHTIGLAESFINDRIKDLFGVDPKVNVALLAGKWRVDVRLTLQGESAEEDDRLASQWREEILGRLGAENVFGEDETQFEQTIGILLRERKQTLAMAESCTGGLIAKLITDIPGSSDYFVEGFVTYANEAKIHSLGVTKETLESHGAVSAETAEAMALGARRVSGVDWALSVTGIAGPGGGSPEKPVGLVYIGLASPDGRVKSRKILGLSDRAAIRELSAVTALDILRRAIIRAGYDPTLPEPPRTDA